MAPLKPVIAPLLLLAAGVTAVFDESSAAGFYGGRHDPYGKAQVAGSSHAAHTHDHQPWHHDVSEGHPGAAEYFAGRHDPYGKAQVARPHHPAPAEAPEEDLPPPRLRYS